VQVPSEERDAVEGLAIQFGQGLVVAPECHPHLSDVFAAQGDDLRDVAHAGCVFRPIMITDSGRT